MIAAEVVEATNGEILETMVVFSTSIKYNNDWLTIDDLTQFDIHYYCYYSTILEYSHSRVTSSLPEDASKELFLNGCNSHGLPPDIPDVDGDMWASEDYSTVN